MDRREKRGKDRDIEVDTFRSAWEEDAIALTMYSVI
jgi:hypothetical protein